MSEPPAKQSLLGSAGEARGHERHCFIVMPFGREPGEQKWFRGWFEVVIKPAVIEAGYEPILSAAEEQPSAINDEIRTHLALDPMVIVDLGGAESDDDPNPNVMYELGIRHAFSLPLVMMAWRGQRLPFDVNNQRAIVEDRELLDIDQNRRKLVAFLNAAREGRYYRPMDAVGRVATIQAAVEDLGADSVLRALVQEVRDMKSAVARSSHRENQKPKSEPSLKKLFQKKQQRKNLYAEFAGLGGTPGSWALLLREKLGQTELDMMAGWNIAQWRDFFSRKLSELQEGEIAPRPLSTILVDVDETAIQRVRDLLPSQPWPTGMHREIAEKLDMPVKEVSKCIQILIQRGHFFEQVDGKIILPESDE